MNITPEVLRKSISDMSTGRSYLSSLSHISGGHSRALLLINTKCKNPAAIERATRHDVTTVLYRHETSKVGSIYDQIVEHLPNNTRVTAVACLLHVSGSAAYIAGGETGLRMSCLSELDEKTPKIEIGDQAVNFFFNLITRFMQETPVSGVLPRIDFFILDIVKSAAKIISTLDQKVNQKLQEEIFKSSPTSLSPDTDETLRAYPKKVVFSFNEETGKILQENEKEAFLDIPSSSFPLNSSHSSSGHKLSEQYRHLPNTVAAIYFRPEKLKTLAQSLLSRASISTLSSMNAFEKVKKVGQGAFGTATLCKRRDDGNHVVLKTINLHDLKQNERQMAVNEAKLLAVLDHPNIIAYYDSFEDDGSLVIVMEYADGGTLDQHLRKLENQLPERKILSMFQQIASGLRYMHMKHVLHRDLKTSNIFLTQDTLIKIGDLGIAKALATITQLAREKSPNVKNKNNNTLVGTPYYISPEICESKPYNEKTDIWSMGCILYEMCMLKKTFDSSNLPAIISKIVSGKVPPLKGNFSSELKKLVKQLLSKEPENRPSAYELYFNKLPAMMDQLTLREKEKEKDKSSPGKKLQFTHQIWHINSRTKKVSRVKSKIFPNRMKIKQLSLGKDHAIMVTEDRVVYGFGSNESGQLGLGNGTGKKSTKKKYSEPILIKALTGKQIISVCAGHQFSLFLSENGIVMSCGSGEFGCLGHGDYNNIWKPRLIENLLEQNITDVSATSTHCLALDADKKSVFVWGTGYSGCLGLKTAENTLIPEKIEFPVEISKVFAGPDCSGFLTNTGSVYVCGLNKFNRLGLNENTASNGKKMLMNAFTNSKPVIEKQTTPVKIPSTKSISDIKFTQSKMLLLTESGQVWTYGIPKDVEKSENPRNSIKFDILDAEEKIIGIEATANQLAVITDRSKVIHWGIIYGCKDINHDNPTFETDTSSDCSSEYSKFRKRFQSSTSLDLSKVMKNNLDHWNSTEKSLNIY